LCSNIRKAEIINLHLPIIKKWEDPHFVTLTVRSVKTKHLRKWMDKGLTRCLGLILDSYRIRENRGTGKRLIGIRSLEYNYNPIKKTYNPHLHLTVANRGMADILVDEWLKRWTPKHTYRGTQDIQRVRNAENILIEVIKYGSKIFTDPDMKKGVNKIPSKIYAGVLDNIYEAMKSCNLFSKFDFKLPKVQQHTKLSPKMLFDFEEWIFDEQFSDWFNPSTGELLTGHVSKKTF